MTLSKLKKYFENPIKTYDLFIKIFIDKFFYKYKFHKSKNFFVKNNFFKYFKEENINEISADFIDLKKIYDLIVERKPKQVLEFGSGFSTIAICVALKNNFEKFGVDGRLYSVDANQKWILNTEKKISSELKKFVKFHYSDAEIKIINNQIVSLHKNLPDISPNFIYLDGPSPLDVRGSINGLSFSNLSINKLPRRIVAADILYYESSAPSDFFILVDRRYSNAKFLEKNLILNYKIKRKLYFGGSVTFEKIYQPYP